MFGVVKSHDLFRNIRLESIVRIIEGRKRVCHGMMTEQRQGMWKCVGSLS